MKRLFVILFLFALYNGAGQPKVSKPPIDNPVIVNWADLSWSEPTLSPDGKYFMYLIENLPMDNGIDDKKSTKIICK